MEGHVHGTAHLRLDMGTDGISREQPFSGRLRMRLLVISPTELPIQPLFSWPFCSI